MKNVFRHIWSNLVKGIIYLVPIVIVVIVLEKGIGFLKSIIAPIARKLPVEPVLGLQLPVILSILVLILGCYLAGLIFSNTKAGRFTRWLETNLLSHIPGYSFMKSSGENILGVENSAESKEVAMVKVDEYWQIGFIMDRMPDGKVSVYIPGAPSPWSGNVCIFTEDRIAPSDMTYKEALDFIKNVGAIQKRPRLNAPPKV